MFSTSGNEDILSITDVGETFAPEMKPTPLVTQSKN